MTQTTISSLQEEKEIAYLSQFMNPERFAILQQVVAQRTRHITVALENIFHPQNASAVIRSAEAFGLQEIHVVENLATFSPNENIVRGSDKWIEIERYSTKTTSKEVIAKLRQRGYRIAAVTPHEVDYTPQTLDISTPIALFMGTEKQGISDDLSQMADCFVKVPMYGFMESLNVSVCAAIVMQTLSERLRGSDIAWQLPRDEQRSLLHKWMKLSVKDSENILKRMNQ